MKVKIISAADKDNWYAKCIGKKYHVSECCFYSWYRVNGYPRRYIRINDCEEVKKVEKAFDQKQSCADVVKALKRRSKRGLSVGEYSDMGRGCDMRKRISELVRDGYTFRTVWEPNKTTTGRHKRYWLLSYKREK